MRLGHATTFISKYRFELIVILIELIACLIVALTLLKLLAPAQVRVLAAEPQVTRRRLVKLLTLPPAQPESVEVERTGIYITVTELPAPTATPELVTLDIPQPVATHSIDTPLTGWPVQGDISQRFGCSPYFSGISGPGCPGDQPWFHDGLDLAAWPGAPVRAGLSGTVSFAGPDGAGPPCGAYRGYGLGVVVDNGAGWQALYAHLAEIHVSAGQPVRPDTVIGTIGQTGCVSGPHLHFGLRYEGALIDPALFKP